jgi:hypothetical protein
MLADSIMTRPVQHGSSGDWPHPIPPDDPRHGTATGYHRGRCRCADCTEAHRIAVATYRAARRAKRAGVAA